MRAHTGERVAAECRHCGRPIERLRIIGWVHVGAFYLCGQQTKSGDHQVADPTSR